MTLNDQGLRVLELLLHFAFLVSVLCRCPLCAFAMKPRVQGYPFAIKADLHQYLDESPPTLTFQMPKGVLQGPILKVMMAFTRIWRAIVVVLMT